MKPYKDICPSCTRITKHMATEEGFVYCIPCDKQRKNWEKEPKPKTLMIKPLAITWLILHAIWVIVYVL